MTTHVALLRGINVGGRNKILMADLRAAFEAEGYVGVSTYIQSGNVVFAGAGGRSPDDAAAVESMLELRFGVPLVVVLVSAAGLRRIVAAAPDGFGCHPDLYHSDVVFLRRPLTSAQAMGVMPLRDGVDRAWAGPGVVYFSRLSERLSQSRMGRIVGTAEYQQMTIRSWNTTTRLLDLVGRAGRNRGSE